MMQAISCKPIWAWMLLNGGKDVENRSRRYSYRGKLVIHSSHMTQGEYDMACQWIREHVPAWSVRKFPEYGTLVQGALVGEVTVTDCVDKSGSPWFQHMYALIVKDPRSYDVPIPYKGMQGLFKINTPE